MVSIPAGACQHVQIFITGMLRVVNMGSSLGHLAVLSSDLQAKLSSDDLAVDQLISLMSQFVR
jgi:hypothetical protein